MILPMKPVPLSKFSWNKAMESLVSEMSTVGDSNLCRIYDDACDCGIYIVSDKTGISFIFALDERESDQEVFTFHPIDETCPIRTVSIFNT